MMIFSEQTLMQVENTRAYSEGIYGGVVSSFPLHVALTMHKQHVWSNALQLTARTTPSGFALCVKFDFVALRLFARVHRGWSRPRHPGVVPLRNAFQT